MHNNKTQFILNQLYRLNPPGRIELTLDRIKRLLKDLGNPEKKLKNVKGISKDTLQQLSQLPTPVITSLINQIGMIVAGDEDEHPPLVKNKEKENDVQVMDIAEMIAQAQDL